MTNPKYTCQDCLRTFSYPLSKAGKVVSCPACKRELRLPSTTILDSAKNTAPQTVGETLAPPPVTQRTKSCPFCAEQILLAAVKCKHCGEIVSKSASAQQTNNISSVLGIMVAVVGGLITFGSLFMETTIQSPLGGRVHNIGLQQQQMMALLLGLAMLGIGIVIALLTKRNVSQADSNALPTAESDKKAASLYLAKNQKYLIWVLLSQLVVGLMLVLLPQIGGLLALLALVLQFNFTLRIAQSLFPGLIAALVVLASLIPFLGLFAIAFIIGRSMEVLKMDGVEVAFWGVPKHEIHRLETKS